MKLSQIDTNLLVALDVLLQERHVTRSAQRLGVTQSAMSQTLGRLRETLDDPLLVRSGSRMVPTPRAEAMRGPLRAALQALDHVLTGSTDFSPATDARRFKLACLDIYSPSILPPLLANLAQTGPGLSIDVLDLKMDDIWDQMRQGTVEVALMGPRPIPSDIQVQALFEDRVVSMVRQDHPILKTKMSAADYVRWPHVVFRITGRGQHPIDIRLQELGLERRIVGRLPYFLAAPATVAQSDLIVTFPRSVALNFAAQRWPLTLFEPPLGAPMNFTVSMVWPGYLDAEPGLQWLRHQLQTIAAPLDQTPHTR